MGNFYSPLIGRFGNQLFQAIYGTALAKKHGVRLNNPPWVGEKIFDIEPACREEGQRIDGYFQRQEDLIYTRRDVLGWLKLKPEIRSRLERSVPKANVAFHIRRGDYSGAGYPVVTEQSYWNAASKFGLDKEHVTIVTEESPLRVDGFDGDLSFLPDFYTLMSAKAIFRGNSSFSWWASTLGEAMTFSPVIDGKEGGKEHDCEFIEGNWPRLANLDFTTNLHLFNEAERYDYPLNEKSVVFDCGGFDGEFSNEIIKRYNCYINIFEPHPEHFEKIKERFKENPRVSVYDCAAGGETRPVEFKYKSNMTGMFSEGSPFMAQIIDLSVFLKHKIDLLKVNIEGMEFEVLERLIATDTAKNCENIQVQFHSVVPDATVRYRKIREELLKTHRPTFYEPWCWEGFERRK